jgi:tetratricopeptide (TPR) repeat protein
VKRSFLCKIRCINLIVLAMLIFGCATLPQKPTPETPKPTAERDPFSAFPERYRSKALEFEKKGELRRALQCWEIVSSFTPTDGEATKKIRDIKARINTLANQHFKKGLSDYHSNSILKARKEFLLTLYYSPDHPEALSYLKNKLIEEDYTLYEVKEGDTLKEIARKQYHDPQKDFLIPYFNDLGKEAKLIPKTVLKLPIIEMSQTKKVNESQEIPADTTETLTGMKDMTGKAVAYFKANKFKETVSVTEEILLNDPSNKEARDLMNASYYQMGKQFSQEKKYREALEQFDHVDSGYKDVKKLTTLVKNQLAEVHYINGIKFFTDEKLDNAIQEWKETLSLNPQHPKARGDMQNAAKLLEKLKEIK